MKSTPQFLVLLINLGFMAKGIGKGNTKGIRSMCFNGEYIVLFLHHIIIVSFTRVSANSFGPPPHSRSSKAMSGMGSWTASMRAVQDVESTRPAASSVLRSYLGQQSNLTDSKENSIQRSYENVTSIAHNKVNIYDMKDYPTKGSPKDPLETKFNEFLMPALHCVEERRTKPGKSLCCWCAKELV